MGGEPLQSLMELALAEALITLVTLEYIKHCVHGVLHQARIVLLSLTGSAQCM